jgi:hypothetical protein
MTDFNASDRDVSRAIRSWLHEDRHEDASHIAGAVLDQVEATPERRAGWPAWRTPTMNRFITFGLGAAAVVVIGILLGAQLLGEPTSIGGRGEATPTPEASSIPTPTATPEPTPSPVAAPPLSGSFTSTLHGYSLSYPEGWDVQAATEPWTDSRFNLLIGEPHADWLSDPILVDHLFLTVASQPIGESTPEEWADEMMATDEGCPTSEAVVVDGASGLIGTDGCELALVTSSGRGYWIHLLKSEDDPSAVAPYDRAWFEEVLATVQLHPEDAID